MSGFLIPALAIAVLAVIDLRIRLSMARAELDRLRQPRLPNGRFKRKAA